jgi:hypothetical protein
MNVSRTALENLNGVVVVLATFFASAQIFNLVVPESGLPFLLAQVFLFVLLVNTLVGFPDRRSVLRSLAVVTGSAFILKFIVLAALSEPGEGALKRMLLVLVEGVTLGTLSQRPLHPATGYVAFATLVLYLVSIAMLPSPRGRAWCPCASSSFPPQTVVAVARSRCCRRVRRFRWPYGSAAKACRSANCSRI